MNSQVSIQTEIHSGSSVYGQTPVNHCVTWLCGILQGRLDRLGRSLPHLIETIAALEARGVGFRSLTESIDTTTSGGRLIFHVFGALGQFERDLIRDRTKAGLTAAAARGRKGGRKPVVTADKLQRAREHIANGLNVREAATRLKVSKTALYAALQPTIAADS